MRLEKIEIVGFKSFADRQVLHVDERVTVVVGPNGCGKSNIVDAVRWAMGEQSAKQLRGGGMGDVIFAGCSSRGPGGMAEVTLTFHNDRGDVPPPYSDYEKIAITRRLFSDGTSEYLINKVPVRLRDIKSLLLGTGAGSRGYSIIEQGQVGKLVTSKPEDRRHVIDEAAGITRFKAQRAAAESKMASTRQNLARVDDMLAELGGRLTTLERQAKKAERYKRYRDELADLELWIASHAYFEHLAQYAVLRGRRDDLARQAEDLRREIEALEGKLSAGRLEKARVEQELSARQEELYAVDNRIRLIESEQDYRKREMEALAGTIAAAEGERTALARALADLEQELARARAEQAEAEAGRGKEASRALARLLEEQAAVRAETADTEASLAAARREAEDLRTRLTRLSAEQEAAEATQADLHQRLARAQAEADAARERLADLTVQLDEARAELSRTEAAAEEARRLGAEIERRRADASAHAAGTEVALDSARAEMHRARSRLQSLEEIQEKYQRCKSGVQVVLAERDSLAARRPGHGAEPPGPSPAPAVYGILAEHIHAPEHLEAAVSAVLGDRLEGVVVDDVDVAAAGVALLKEADEGRTTFLPRTLGGQAPPSGRPIRWQSPDTAAATMEVVDLSRAGDGSPPPSSEPGPLSERPEVLGRLADLVGAEGPYTDLVRGLLGETLVLRVPLARAIEIWHAQRPKVPLVTLEGDRIDPNGIVVGGAPAAVDAALLQQKREIEHLRGLVGELEDALARAKDAHHAALARVQALDHEREEAEQSLRRASADHARAQQAVADLASRVDEQRAAWEARRSEAETLAKQLQDLAASMERIGSEVHRCRTRLPVVDERIASLEEALRTSAARAEELAEAVAQARVEQARWEETRKTLADAADRLARQVRSEKARLERLATSESQARERLRELSEAADKAKAEHHDLLARSRSLSDAVHDVREAHERWTHELDEVEVSLRSLRSDLEAVAGRLSEVELGLRENELERRHLEEDVAARCNVALREVLADYHTRPIADADAHARRKELRRIVARMGDVHMGAIEEFERVRERHGYLSQQRDDLLSALAQLEDAIAQIDKESRQRFRATFDRVNEKFQQVFPRLFNGGRAELRLTDPQDLLNTGVEIVAQPPGKQLRNLELLSGGEKALTATSLIFAVFLIKPSPFCILDEVDAPLDDANVVRFCSLVSTLSESTQFIIITHNKITMETADRIYGVTMEQRGISKLVSVNMRRAVELAEVAG